MPKIEQTRIIKELYRSPRTVVFLVESEIHGTCAFKTVNPDSDLALASLENLRYEAEILYSLDDPRLLKPLALDETPGSQGLYLPFFDAPSLAARLNREGGMSLQQFWDCARQVLEVLTYIHSKGLVHKDINPNNILVASQETTVRLIDFEIASRVWDDRQKDFTSDHLEGTLAYMSPEQTGRVDMPVDARSDLYSFGISCFEMLTGKLPFQAHDRIGFIHAHLSLEAPDPRKLRSDLPRELAAIIQKLLLKNPKERYQSAYGLLRDLEQLFAPDALKVSEFILGRDDLPVHFEAPHQLLGREQETLKIEQAFALSSQGQIHICGLAGASGVGKSSLARHARSLTLKQQGLYLESKCEQGQQHASFFPFQQLFKMIVQRWQSMPESQFKELAAELRRGIGEQLKALEQITVAMQVLTQDLPELPSCGLKEAEDRLAFVTIEVLRALGRNQILTLFFDDIQWMDQASLQLLSSIIEQADGLRLFVLMAYRVHETGENAKAIALLRRLQNQPNCHLHDIRDFDEARTSLYLNKVFPRLKDHASLTSYVHERTKGNPYYLGQYLRRAAEERIISFNFAQGYWEADLTRLQQMLIADDLAGFLVHELDRLDRRTLKIAQMAAILGFEFTLAELQQLSGWSYRDLKSALSDCAKASIVMPMNEQAQRFLKYGERQLSSDRPTSYRFQHDRMYQACYQMLSEHEAQEWHFRFGRILEQDHSTHTDAERFMLMVEHLNRGCAWMKSREEKLALAHYNAEAAQTCFDKVAFQKAEQLLQQIEGLLGAELWSHHELAWTSCLLLTQLAYHAGRMADGDRTWQTMLLHARTQEQKAELYRHKLELLSAVGEKSAAIEAGLRGLKELGISVSARPNPFQVLTETARTLPMMALVNVEALLQRPMVDGSDRLALKLLVSLAPAAYTSGQENLYVVAIMKAVRLTLRKGISEDSALTFVYGGGVAMIAFGIAGLARKFAGLADRLNAERQDLRNRAKIRFLNGAFVYSWLRPWRAISPYVKEGRDAGLMTGDFYFTRLCTLHYQEWDLQFSLDEEIASLEERLRFVKSLGPVPLDDAAALMAPHLAVAQELRNGESNFSFDAHCDAMREKDYASGSAITCLLLLKRAWFLGQWDEAREWDLEVRRFQKGLLGLPWLVDSCLYRALLLADYPSHKSWPLRIRKTLGLGVQLLKAYRWYALQREQFAFIFHLLCAEWAQSLAWRGKAQRHYCKAIAEADHQNVSFWSALAYERLAKTLRSQGLDPMSDQALHKSLYYYKRWGSKLRVNQIAQQLGLNENALEPRENISGGHTTTIHLGHETLDTEAIVTAAESLAGEVEINQVVRKLLQLSLQYSGSDRVVLILRDLTEASLMVVGHAKGEEIAAGLRESIDSYPDLAKGALMLAARSKKEVLIHDCEEARAELDYNGELPPESLAILPIMNKGQVAGLLYLENHLMKNAYSLARLRLMTLLSSQMAISLQNALLFEQMKEKIWLENELAAAKAVQETLLPSHASFGDFEIAASYRAADSTGGDWFWYHFAESEHKLYVMIGDVTGHGIPSALVTGTVSGAIQACLGQLDALGSKDPRSTLESIAAHVNHVIYNTGRKANRVMSMAFICLDLEAMQGYYLNAAHNALLHLHSAGFSTLLEPGSLLGQLTEPTFGFRSFSIEKDDCFFLFTDGLIENGGTQRQQKLSTKSLGKLLSRDDSARESVSKIEAKTQELWDGFKAVDDTTFLMVKVLCSGDKKAAA
ncbi:MAG TPA: SpoIIE family protein phosphatase [Oligoflexus sp.]|uniref:protein kinase domain-containing protein n=1 Tax=Oligoflexus sp. TaxID=1971216 RepID=UPI002D7F7F74|nr:SpoIIE family protein phosphatase [Oligoflexus sp.]HET9239345.1 SpoIIE family protein phosphatase [Oligoflexus sp.]